jgi:hypothetical protein
MKRTRTTVRPSSPRPALAVVLALAAVATGCGGGKTTAAGGAAKAPSHVTIAYQPGIAYAPLIVIKHDGTLEKQLPDTTFTWKVLSSGVAVRDGIDQRRHHGLDRRRRRPRRARPLGLAVSQVAVDDERGAQHESGLVRGEVAGGAAALGTRAARRPSDLTFRSRANLS